MSLEQRARDVYRQKEGHDYLDLRQQVRMQEQSLGIISELPSEDTIMDKPNVYDVYLKERLAKLDEINMLIYNYIKTGVLM